MSGAIGFGPSLALRQRRRGAAYDFSGGVLPAGATLTRASVATRTSAAGVLATEAADVARFDYAAGGGSLRGLLIEDAATNLLLRSSAFAMSPWVPATGLTVSATETGPDGTTSAAILNDTNSVARAITQTVSATSGNVCLSLYVKADSIPRATRYAMIRFSGSIELCLDTATGEIVNTSGTATYGCSNVGGWWRIWLAASASTTLAYIYPARGEGSPMGMGTYNGATMGAITAFGAQLETGSVPSSYIATGAATATRAADVLVLDWARHGVGDGACVVRYGFDDGSMQDVATTVASGVATVSVTLNRRHVVSVRVV